MLKRNTDFSWNFKVYIYVRQGWRCATYLRVQNPNVQTTISLRPSFVGKNVYEMLLLAYSCIVLSLIYKITVFEFGHVTHGNGGHLGFDKIAGCGMGNLDTWKQYNVFDWNKLLIKVYIIICVKN